MVTNEVDENSNNENHRKNKNSTCTRRTLDPEQAVGSPSSISTTNDGSKLQPLLLLLWYKRAPSDVLIGGIRQTTQEHCVQQALLSVCH
mmetsp:Transcript_52202/g.58331  ORF Transcript_52202/g.58331 Transcript_52202/m.58331 type:complete len:89 (+) Transcript_52202:489-755(+)